MKIYLDENLPPMLAEGFNILQAPESKRLGLNEPIEVLSMKEVFGENVEDEEWIPKVGKQNACVITQDYNINRNKHQKSLCEEYGLGMFYFKPPLKKGFTYWEMVKHLAKHWPEIIKHAAKKSRPFSYRFTAKSSRLISLDE